MPKRYHRKQLSSLASLHHTMSSWLDKFQLTEVLRRDATTKQVCLLGLIDGENAIVTLTKQSFDLEDPSFKTNLGVDSLKLLDRNHAYRWHVATLRQSLEHPTAKVDLIYPATETHIRNNRNQAIRVIKETPEMYQKVVVPYIESMLGDRVQWVDNILHHGVEADKVVFRDDSDETGFVLLPDMKWDGQNISSLYLVAIVKRDDLNSIRDLNQSHIAFLKQLRQIIYETVERLYGLKESEIKLYFHYQPSFYRMHVHVANVCLNQNDFGRSVLLDNVIDQLQFLGDEGFKKLTLTYVIGEDHTLYGEFVKLEKETASEN